MTKREIIELLTPIVSDNGLRHTMLALAALCDAKAQETSEFSYLWKSAHHKLDNLADQPPFGTL